MGYMLYLAAVERAMPLSVVAALIACGILIWSFVEYTMHRWVFHYQPRAGGENACTFYSTGCITITRTTPADW